MPIWSLWIANLSTVNLKTQNSKLKVNLKTQNLKWNLKLKAKLKTQSKTQNLKLKIAIHHVNRKIAIHRKQTPVCLNDSRIILSKRCNVLKDKEDVL